MSEMEGCPVCLEPLRADESSPTKFDNALCCQYDHRVCTSCIAKISRPVDKCNTMCSGLCFKCPICRANACITNMTNLVVVKGSWRKAYEYFPREKVAFKWNRQPVAIRSSISRNVSCV